MSPIKAIVLATALITGSVRGADYYVDLQRGRDDGNGGRQAPFKTLSAAFEAAAGGDAILLGPGEYPEVAFRRTQDNHVFENDYVTVKASPDVTDPVKQISIQRVNLSAYGKLNHPPIPGCVDVYVRFERVRILDGVALSAVRRVQLVGCRIERLGPWVGSVEDIEKFAVAARGTSYVLVQDCEITDTAGGLALSGSNMQVLGNTIHDITHDGIRCISLQDSLIEGNRIYNLDDGVDDSDPRGKGWNRHCDAIHFFIPGPGLPKARNRGVTVRGNMMYNCESQAMQFNNYLRVKDVWNQDITIENNIFGPTRANVINIADPVDGIIVRNNTYVYFPEGRTFRGLGRDIHCANHTFRINQVCKRAEVFNNIFCNGFKTGTDWFVGHNLILNKKPHEFLTRHDLSVDDAGLVDPAAFDGRLAADSPAIDAGTRMLPPSGICPVDFYGTPRDARPDCGAFEFPGRNPEAEPPLPVFEGPARVFLDDFRDANTGADPWLAGSNQKGLSWAVPDGQKPWTFTPVGDDVALSAIGLQGTNWILTAEGEDWKDCTLTVVPRNAYNASGGGFLLRGRLDTTGYLVDLARGVVALRTRGGSDVISETVLATGAPLLPRTTERTFKIRIADTPEGTRITVDAEADGSIELTALDPAKRIASGRIGIYNLLPNPYHRMDVLSVRIDIR